MCASATTTIEVAGRTRRMHALCTGAKNVVRQKLRGLGKRHNRKHRVISKNWRQLSMIFHWDKVRRAFEPLEE